MQPKILVIGSSNTDMVIKVPYIPRPGETILGGTFSTCPGGKGANQALAAARAGGAVSLVARIGQDMFGDTSLEGFEHNGINCQYVIRDHQLPSGVASIFVDAEGRNSIAVASGANANLLPDDIEKLRDVINSSDILLMQLEIPVKTVSAAAKIAADNGVPVILNPAPAQVLDQQLLDNISLITPNEIEAQMLTEIAVDDLKSAASAAKKLRAQGPAAVIITLGENGAYVAHPEYEGHIPAYKVDVVDSTAAGDVFNGVLAVQLAAENSIEQSVRIAGYAAALSVTKLGAQSSIPTWNQIKDYKSFND